MKTFADRIEAEKREHGRELRDEAQLEEHMLERLDREMHLMAETHTCVRCKHKGIDVHEYPTYSIALGHDTTDFFCDEPEQCWKRSENKRSITCANF